MAAAAAISDKVPAAAPWPHAISIVILINNVRVMLTATPVAVMLTRTLALTPADINYIYAAMFIPTSFEALYALLSDKAPLLGERRRPYFVVFAALQALATLFLSQASSKTSALVWSILLGAANSGTTAVANGCVADVARQSSSTFASGAASACEALRWAGNVIGTALAALLLYLWTDPRSVLLFSCVCPIAVVFAALFVPPQLEPPPPALTSDGDDDEEVAEVADVADESAALLSPQPLPALPPQQQQPTTPQQQQPPTATIMVVARHLAKHLYAPILVVAGRALVPSHRTTFSSFAYQALEGIPSYQYTIASAAGNLGSLVGAAVYFRILRMRFSIRQLYISLALIAAAAPLMRIALFVMRLDEARRNPTSTLVLLCAWNFVEDAMWSAALVPGMALIALNAVKGYEALSFAIVATITAWVTTVQGYISGALTAAFGVRASDKGWTVDETNGLSSLILLCCLLHALLLPPLYVFFPRK
ncbi:BT1 family [Pycnococcus provasolii]